MANQLCLYKVYLWHDIWAHLNLHPNEENLFKSRGQSRWKWIWGAGEQQHLSSPVGSRKSGRSGVIDV